MKTILKLLIPGLIVTAVLLAYLTNQTFIWGTVILVLVPLMFIYIITQNLKEVRSRSRNDTGVHRNLLIIFSLLSSFSLLGFYLSSILNLPGTTVIKASLLIVLMISVIPALFYYIKNYKSLDNYVSSEYFIIATPILIGLLMALSANWIDRTDYNSLWKNFEDLKSINTKLEKMSSPNSFDMVHLAKISETQSAIVVISGGYHESGFLVDPLDTDIVGTIIIVQGFHKELVPILKLYSIENDPFRDLEYGGKMTVADALVNLEFIKTNIYYSILEKDTVLNKGHTQ